MVKRALTFAAIVEVATGLTLVIVPSLVGQLLLGRGTYGRRYTGRARRTGIALIGLGLSCWPGPPLIGMITYSAAVALYLAYVGVVGGFAGIFLWPAVVPHAILSVLLGSVWLTTEPHRRL